jgi:hypothetical protein
VSHFGYGILTWHIPYLFRTPPGYNLLVRGPSNWPKDGVTPLEGVVEADWAAATFTMNWKLTRPGALVTFDEGEPICMLLPQARGELEAFQPEIHSIAEEANAQHDYQEWSRSRARFLVDLRRTDSETVAQSWQRHYFQGTSPSGRRAAEHQTRRPLRHFREAPSGDS